MSALTHPVAPITLAPYDYAGEEANDYSGWHASAPLLFGFVTPLALAVSFHHQWLRDTPIFLILLLAALVVSSLLFVGGLICNGEVKAVIVDPNRNEVALVRHNPFANSTWHIGFGKVEEIKSVIHYDRFGRKTLTPELVLTSGTHVPLPADIDRRDLAAARATIERYREMALPAPQRQRSPRYPGRRAD
jgi:hypothetical protein